jgi:hypothetical protein
MKDLNNELLLVTLQCSDFTHQVVCFGLQELLKFVLSDLTLPEDFNCEEFIEGVKLNLDEPISVGSYEITVQVASPYSKSQILNYFENE